MHKERVVSAPTAPTTWTWPLCMIDFANFLLRLYRVSHLHYLFSCILLVIIIITSPNNLYKNAKQGTTWHVATCCMAVVEVKEALPCLKLAQLSVKKSDWSAMNVVGFVFSCLVWHLLWHVLWRWPIGLLWLICKHGECPLRAFSLCRLPDIL